MVIFGGQVTLGNSRSLTMTLKLQEALFPLASVAVQVTVLVPLLKLDPLGGTHAFVAPEQLSLTVGAAKFTTRAHKPGAVLVVMSVGHVMAGKSLSLTVTVKEQALVLPLVSLAVQVTVVTPLLNVEPLRGVQLTVAPEQLSLNVGFE